MTSRTPRTSRRRVDDRVRRVRSRNSLPTAWPLSSPARRIVAGVSLWPPDSVRSTYAAWTWTIAWEWPELATTWRLEEAAPGARVLFMKVITCGHYPTAADEADRMTWARNYL